MSVKMIILPVKFLKEVKTELDLVTWPSHQEAIKLTGVVIIASIITGIYLGALDITFTSLFQQLIK